MKRFLLPALAFVGACAGPKPTVHYQGTRETPLVNAEQMGRAPDVPRGGQRLGSLSASCRSAAEFEAFEERSLADIDCSHERLTRMLDEAGAAAGGDLLVDLTCHGFTTLSCEATLARRPESSLASARVIPTAGNVFGQLGAEIRISFAPSAPSPGRPVRPLEVVRELPALPPSHRVIGSLESRCDDAQCPELAVRDSLRIAAGRLGLEDVVAVRCFSWASGYRCLGSGAVAERVSSLPPHP